MQGEFRAARSPRPGGRILRVSPLFFYGSDSRPQGDRLAEAKSEAPKASPSRSWRLQLEWLRGSGDSV